MTTGRGDRSGPDFVCIGAQKAGTTWLYDNLALQPGVWLPPVKELHFFNRVCPAEELLGVEERVPPGFREKYRPLIERPGLRTLRWIRRFHHHGALSNTWYYSLFPADVVEGRKAGDITPAYSTLDDRGVAFARRVLKPDCRILLLVRDPVERLWSAVKMMYRWKDERISNAALDDILREVDWAGYRLRNDYPRMVRLWRDAFGENFRVFRYDSLAAAPERFLMEVRDHIGVDGRLVTTGLSRRSNRDPSERPVTPRLRSHLQDRFRPQIEELDSLLSEMGARGVAEDWLSPVESDSV